jgi:hypothetical protein
MAVKWVQALGNMMNDEEKSFHIGKCGPYYKNMIIVNDTSCGVTLESSIMLQENIHSTGRKDLLMGEGSVQLTSN